MTKGSIMHRTLLAACAAALLGATASAHVTLETQEAAPDSLYRAVFRVPHGCGEAATIRLAVTLPEGVRGARPMPKPGWRLTLVPREDRPTPQGHGAARELHQIVWEGGPLPSEHYDEFVIRFRTPNTPGQTLWIPVVQGCEGGRETAWTQVPEPGRRASDYPTPAPALRILPRN
ncbi:YcnI family protein [Elioraea sp.]|uniref:YcnI family protein n=1 Tax=Elioraea sp. TaxID=2185103 RepID=UPI00307E643D